MSLEGRRRFDFRRGVVVANAPRTPGVYALFHDDELCYVDEAANICRALSNHLDDPNAAPHLRAPLTFAFEPGAAADRTARVVQLVFKCQPVCTARRELKAREP